MRAGAWPTSRTCSAPRCLAWGRTAAPLRALVHLSRRVRVLSRMRQPARAPGRPPAAPARVVGPVCRPAAAAPRAAWPGRHLAAAGRQPRRTSRGAQHRPLRCGDAAAAECPVRVRRRRLRLPGAASAGPGAGDAACCSTGIRWPNCGTCWCRNRARPSCASAPPNTAGCRRWNRAAAKSAWCRPRRACTGCGSTRSAKPSGSRPCWPRPWWRRRAPMRRQLGCLVRGNAGVLVLAHPGCRAGARPAVRMRRAAAVGLVAPGRL